MMPPLIMSVRVREQGKKGFGIWLPLFLVWPFALVLVLLLLPVILITDFILALTRSRFSVTRAVFALWGVLCALRGLSVDVQNERNNNVVRVQAR